MKYFLFLLLLFVFVSCDNDPVSNSEIGKSCEVEKYVNKCDGNKRVFCDNNKVNTEDCQGSCVDGACCENKDKKVATSYKDNKCFYKCEDDYKACVKQEDNTYSCSNIDLSADFECLAKGDINTCLNGKACPDKANAKATQCILQIEDGKDKSDCIYKCQDGFGDCDKDLNNSNNNNPNGCESNFSDLNLKQCGICTDYSCNFDGDWLNGCEKMPDSLGTCHSCKLGYCDYDNNLSNGCIAMPEGMTDCENCKVTFCNYNGDLSTGCIPRHETLDACEVCKIGYKNLDQDWSTGCVEPNYSNDPDNCGYEGHKCPKSSNLLMLRQCKDKKCGFICNEELAYSYEDKCCSKAVSITLNEECGECLNGEYKNDCKNKDINSYMIGRVTKCVDGIWEKDKSCYNNNSCDGQSCGECVNDHIKCLSETELGICKNGKYEHKYDCALNCYQYYCDDANE